MGRRVPFIGSALLVFLGLWIRKGIDETPAFKKNQEEGKVVDVPLFETLKTHKKEVLIAIGAKCVEPGRFISCLPSSCIMPLKYSPLSAVKYLMPSPLQHSLPPF